MMLPSVLMKRTIEKKREAITAEDLTEVLHSIYVGRLREAFNKLRKC